MLRLSVNKQYGPLRVKSDFCQSARIMAGDRAMVEICSSSIYSMSLIAVVVGKSMQARSCQFQLVDLSIIEVNHGSFR